MSEVGGSDSLSTYRIDRLLADWLGAVERIAISRVTLANRSELFAAATAVSAVGLLGLSAPAPAGPMFPLAPPCSQWGFPGQFSLYQSNGYTVQFPATGPTVHGFVPATAANVDGEMGANGVDGSIQGSRIDFTILWHLG